MSERTPTEKQAFREWFCRWFGGFDYGSAIAARCRTWGVSDEYGSYLVSDGPDPTREEWFASLTPEMRRLFLRDEAYAEALRRRNDRRGR
jgi:hypothetical protein